MKLHHKTMPSDLAILDAEQYIGTAGPGKTGKAKKAHLAQADDGPRKKAKTSSVAEETEANDDGDERSKRARGRPRLDTKDQTAAERRRTQIRLAQRAYRSRKENAIQTLEKTVEDLQETNEEMSNAFMKLHDCAVSSGILDHAPDFARELRATTEKFLSLVRKPSDGNGSDSQIESPDPESAESGQPPGAQSARSQSPKVVEAQASRDLGNTVLGYNVTSQVEIRPSFPINDLPTPSGQQTATQGSLGYGYEVITMPTLDNASFPFDFSAGAVPPDFSAGAVPPDFFGQPTVTPSTLPPYLSAGLPPPSSVAFSESTFGRRLQRSAVEVAYHLTTMSNPPRDEVLRIFGFCMLFEPMEKIRERLGQAVGATAQENLNYWGAPFWALGGAGDHQFATDGSTYVELVNRRVGNQGTEDVGKHGFDSKFSIGPFDAKVTEARDRRIGPGMRIKLPGWEDDFFDPEDVELYLQSKGIVIAPGQDYVTAEVDASWFQTVQQEDRPSGDWSLQPSEAFLSGPTTTGLESSGWGLNDDLGANVFGATTSASAGLEDEAAWAAFTGNSVSLGSQKKFVTLNVDVFIQDLLRLGACLVRTPGFREKDVNHAIWLATRSDPVLAL